MVRGPLRQELDEWQAYDRSVARQQAKGLPPRTEPKIKGPYYDSNNAADDAARAAWKRKNG